MAIWGKIIGTSLGFALGGAVGGVVGFLAGSIADSDAVESMVKNKSFSRRDPFRAYAKIYGDRDDVGGERRMVFMVSVIALAAKIAKVDGSVSPQEIRAFRRVFPIPPDEEDNVAQIYNEARRSADNYQNYARRLAHLLQRDANMRRRILSCLVAVAEADGIITRREDQYLRNVARIFEIEIDASAHRQQQDAGFQGRQTGGGGARAAARGRNPYAVLGLKPTADDATVKNTYRRLVRQNHPDGMMARGVPRNKIAAAEKKLADINAAYDEIARIRGL